MGVQAKRKLLLPNKEGTYTELEVEGAVVIVGRNGAGKSRLGAWIELDSNHYRVAHRISAQKSLAFPTGISPIDTEAAISSLRYGHPEVLAGRVDFLSVKRSSRYRGKSPTSHNTDDYAQLVIYLLSESFEKSSTYLQSSLETNDRVKPPLTKLSVLKKIWEAVLPGRKLSLDGASIGINFENSAPGAKPYAATELSDGERVIFYLIGQCLAAPDDAVIIVDEPEGHLHRSLQLPLWEAIQRERKDCLFVFITHDLDFAASICPATRIWVKSFNGAVWDWELLSEANGITEDVRLNLLGARKKVLFVEGEASSLDVALYRVLFPGYLVVPKGTATQVVEAVKALKSAPDMHYLSVSGIVDGDRRSEQEVASLERNGVGVLAVAEVENLFVTEGILRIVAINLHLNVDDVLHKAKAYIVDAFKKELALQLSEHAAARIHHELGLFDTKIRDAAEARAEINKISSGIDTEKIFDSLRKSFSEAIESNNFAAVLKWYNRKSLADRVAPIFGLSPGGVQRMVLGVARSDNQATEVSNALRDFLPNISKTNNPSP